MQSLNALWNGYSINTNLSEYYSGIRVIRMLGNLIDSNLLIRTETN